MAQRKQQQTAIETGLADDFDALQAEG